MYFTVCHHIPLESTLSYFLAYFKNIKLITKTHSHKHVHLLQIALRNNVVTTTTTTTILFSSPLCSLKVNIKNSEDSYKVDT